MTREEAIEIVQAIKFIDDFEDYSDRLEIALDMAIEALKERPHGKCKSCKHYNPYREQFSYRPRGDGYCKSTITNAEGQAYINCHDEWYCANYEKAGEKE